MVVDYSQFNDLKLDFTNVDLKAVLDKVEKLSDEAVDRVIVDLDSATSILAKRQRILANIMAVVKIAAEVSTIV